MKNKSILIIVLIALISVAGILVWKNISNTSESKHITIGAVLPLTGDVASYGNKIKNGIILAQELSESKIQITFEDSKSKQVDAVSSINKLINNGVKIIIGEVSSGSTKAIAPIAEKGKVLLLSPSASDPIISTMGDYIFRIYPSDNYEGNELIKFISQNSYKEIYTITMLTDYGVGLKNVFANSASANGFKILGQYDYKQGETNFNTLLTKIKNKNAAVVIVGYGTELGTIVKQAREIGLKNQFFSTVNFYDQNSIKSGGSAVDGVVFSALYLDTLSVDKSINDFTAKYKARYGEAPDIWSALGFDCFNIIINSIVDSSGNVDVEAVIAKLYNLKDYLGVSGKTTFDKNGDVIKPINFMKVQKDKFIPINLN